ncbi:hypothetical protein [Pseudoalteromonas ostreae]|uniref:hypothetical protein n=1 Tax=Pseudoalteromonas ostreae TaxID=2774154 RepID=UPI001B387D59|nr:hypothetical protein [Pseudoalteromonas ostreae]
MIKPLAILFFILFLAGCTEDKFSWQGYCLPNVQLTPATLASGTSSLDKNFDSATDYGPTLFFSGETVAKEVSAFKAFTPDPLFGKYQHNIQVNLSHNEITLNPTNTNELRASELAGIYFEDLSEYNWNAYQKVGSNYEFWGSCMLDGSGEQNKGYSCLRQLKVNNTVLSFDLDYVNIHIHKQVDEFLVEKLNNWRCD